MSQTTLRGTSTGLLREPRSVIDASGVSRRFGSAFALNRVSLHVRANEIHALLGPNGAGKTTLLRILAGLVEPTEGTVRILHVPSAELRGRAFRRLVGLVPSGDRSFYLRISGLENLLFFGRLHGMTKSQAKRRAWECLEAVGITDAARTRVGVYSHGMQKRLSVARALLVDPPVLLVDEATHDLDPDGSRRIQALVSSVAQRGTAVVWATQRVDEIRGFVDNLTLLDRGHVRFTGTVPQLMSKSSARGHLLHLRDGAGNGNRLLTRAREALAEKATITTSEVEGDQYLISLLDHVTLGEAVAALTRVGIQVLACRAARSEIEEAFLSLTGADQR